MLNLHCPTPDRWFEQVAGDLDTLLIDHAHCEKKAAGVAMGLLFAYVEDGELCRAMTEIVNEELSHFQMVLDVLARRGTPFRRLRPGRYGERLMALCRREDPDRAVDRLLVAGLIEARSCERFKLLSERLADRELCVFYAGLFESEARHHSTYVRLARGFAPAEAVKARLDELAGREAEIISEGEPDPRMHS